MLGWRVMRSSVTSARASGSSSSSNAIRTPFIDLPLKSFDPWPDGDLVRPGGPVLAHGVEHGLGDRVRVKHAVRLVGRIRARGGPNAAVDDDVDHVDPP